MAKTKMSRKEMLKKPDEFITLSSKAISYIKSHKRQFNYLGMAVLCLIIIYLGIYAYTKYINKKGQEAFNTAYYYLLSNTGSDESGTDIKKREELFSNITENYGFSKAAKLALPELAYSKFEQKQYDEAIAKYKDYLKGISENDPYISLARLSLSTCYEQKGEYDKAIESLQRIMEGPDDFIKEQAMLSLIRLYRLDNKQEKSDELLAQFKEKFPDSIYLDLADSFKKS